jgi:hypothetical protein
MHHSQLQICQLEALMHCHLFVDIPQTNHQIDKAANNECCRKSVLANDDIQLKPF